MVYRMVSNVVVRDGAGGVMVLQNGGDDREAMQIDALPLYKAQDDFVFVNDPAG